jgi:acyl-CoA synthetase (AMP-forming)/AMP-acid ligase II
MRPPHLPPGTIEAELLAATLREAAKRFGESPAYFAVGGWPVSYVDLDRISDEVAASMHARGVGEGDVVALILPPSPEYVVCYLASAKVGAITAGVNDRLAAAERDAVLQLVDPRLVLAAPGFAPSDFDTVEVQAAESIEGVLDALRSTDTPPSLPEDPERPLAILFTSGTTGTPKAALYCNRQVSFITQTDVGDTWGGGGRGYLGTSFAHLGFMTKLPGNLQRGGVNFLMPRWSARAALELAARERMTQMGGVPAQLALMLRDPEFDSFDLDSVQFVVTGGGPITPGLAEEVRARFRAKLATRYSCTSSASGDLIPRSSSCSSTRRTSRYLRAKSARSVCAPPRSCPATGAIPTPLAMPSPRTASCALAISGGWTTGAGCVS